MPETSETVETPAISDDSAAPETETVETEASVEKSLDDMTPEELKEYAAGIIAERDNWKKSSRTHEDQKKANFTALKKLEEQLNESKPVEQVNADRIAALEAHLAESRKEAEILKLTKAHDIPDEALELLQSASLEQLPQIAETVLALVAAVQAKAPKASAPALPVNPAQGTESKPNALNGAELELAKLLSATN